MIRRFATSIAALAVFIGAVPVQGADLAECAAIADDRRRLACYDKLAGRRQAEQPSGEADGKRVLREIIRRCQRQMGSYGDAMVKGCVDLDREAHAALARYPAEYRAIVDRCTRQMSGHGWAMVKGCADLDIDARRALKNMKKR